MPALPLHLRETSGIVADSAAIAGHVAPTLFLLFPLSLDRNDVVMSTGCSSTTPGAAVMTQESDFFCVGTCEALHALNRYELVMMVKLAGESEPITPYAGV